MGLLATTINKYTPDIPQISAKQFTGTMDEVMEKMTGQAKTLLESVVNPLQTSYNTLSQLYSTADNVYSTANTAYEIAQFASNNISKINKLERVKIQAEKYKKSFESAYEYVENIMKDVKSYTDDIRNLITNSKKYAIQYVEDKINYYLKQVYEIVNKAKEWVDNQVAAIKEKYTNKGAELTKKALNATKKIEKSVAETKGVILTQINKNSNRANKLMN